MSHLTALLTTLREWFLSGSFGGSFHSRSSVVPVVPLPLGEPPNNEWFPSGSGTTHHHPSPPHRKDHPMTTTQTLTPGQHARILDNAAGYSGGIGRVLHVGDGKVAVLIGVDVVWTQAAKVESGRFVDGMFFADADVEAIPMSAPPARGDQCDATCTTDCGHCKGVQVVDEALTATKIDALSEDLRLCMAPTDPVVEAIERATGLNGRKLLEQLAAQGLTVVTVQVEDPELCQEPDLPLHRQQATFPPSSCSTCDGGGCPDCTDPA